MQTKTLGPALATRIADPPADCETLLCFEHNAAGFEAAAAFTEDLEEMGCEGVYFTHSPPHIERLTPQHAEEFEGKAGELRRELFLRSVTSGLSPIGEHMLALLRKKLSADEIMGATSRRFRIPMRDAKREYTALCMGSIPLVTDPYMEAWPHALLNGPFPLSKETLREAIVAKINTRRFQLTDPAPGCEGHDFRPDDGGWVSEYEELSDGTVRWPYGVLPELHEGAIKTPQGFASPEPFALRLEWNPEFREGHFSLDAALDAWIARRLDVLVEKRAALVAKKKFENVKNRFVRNICVLAKVEGRDATVFLGETERAKRTRIAAEYNNHLELLDTPVIDLETRRIFSNSVVVPESARDMLLEELSN